MQFNEETISCQFATSTEYGRTKLYAISFNFPPYLIKITKIIDCRHLWAVDNE